MSFKPLLYISIPRFQVENITFLSVKAAIVGKYGKVYFIKNYS